MKINKAYKFRLEPNAEQEIILNNLVGSARFVWNQMLAISFEMFAKNEFINATNLVNKIMDLKNNPDFSFLAYSKKSFEIGIVSPNATESTGVSATTGASTCDSPTGVEKEITSF